MRLAGRAVELSGHADPGFLDTQAAAQAAAGRFDLAIQSARMALALASEAHADALAGLIRQRLALYERRTAYPESAAARPGPEAR